jgi:hypothetical protein
MILFLGKPLVRSPERLRAVMNYPTGPRGNLIDLPNDFIVPVGGGYFFVPSIGAIKTVLAA